MSRVASASLVMTALALASTGCGDDLAAPDASTDLLARIQALPGVTAAELVPQYAPAGYRYLRVDVDLPVDHAAPGGAHFQQHLGLVVKDPTAPVVLYATGYWDYKLDRPFELMQLLHGNQLVMEHRYFGTSRPSPADWTKLTIEQAAADEHDVIERLEPILTGPWIATGQSKGGMTSIYHRRFHPDDVAGTVAYVAPIMFSDADYRFDTWVEDTIGTQVCRDAVKAVATELLAHRRAMLEQRAQAEAAAGNIQYTRVAIGPAVESAVASLYWAFWQYYGKDFCASVPAPTASDDALWQMLEGTSDGGGIWAYGVSPVYANDDANLARFEAWIYQSAQQLGSPATHDTYLDGLTKYVAADYAGILPVGVPPPAYDGGAAMNDVAAWVKADASEAIWVYGGWDPWTGGKFDVTGAPDAFEAVVPEATHEALLTGLAPADQAVAFARLQAWTGVTPDPTAVPAAAALRRAAPSPREPALRPPPALVRWQQLRAR